MRWVGTAAGGAIGFLFGGPLGALFGATVGQGVDRGLGAGSRGRGTSEAERARIQAVFFDGTFRLLGHAAKADGHVSLAEIGFAEEVMARLGLDGVLRRQAMELFEQGKAPDVVPILERLGACCARERGLQHLLLQLLISMVYLDGPPSPAQRRLLDAARRALRVSHGAFLGLEQLVALQQRLRAGAAAFGTGQGAFRGELGTQSLRGAYATLGVEPGSSDAEVKRAYRRLMSRHHPDKLASRGLSEESLRRASRKTQEIRRAYEAIARARAA